MKKHYSKILMVLLIVVILCTALAGCNGKDVEKTDTADIAAFATKLREANSFTFELKGICKDDENIEASSIIQFDGKKVYYTAVHVLGEPLYGGYVDIAESEKYAYQYYNEGEQWYYYYEDNVEALKRSTYEMRESGISFFNSENFEQSKEKNAFVIKKGKDVGGALFSYEGVINNNFSMMIKDDEATITFVSDIEGRNFDITVTLKDINNTRVTMPANALEDKKYIFVQFVHRFDVAESFSVNCHGKIEGRSIASSVKFDGNKLHMETKNVADTGKDEDIYMSVVDGKLNYYTYDSDNSKWYYRISENTEAFVSTKNLLQIDMMNLIREWNFVYSEDKKAFILKEGVNVGNIFGSVEISELTLVLKHNSATISVKFVNDIYTYYTLTFGEINSTKIILPENAIERID